MARNTVTSSGEYSLRSSNKGRNHGRKAILLFCVLYAIVLQLTTQYIASQLFYHPSLGTFFPFGGQKIYPFYRCFFWFYTLIKTYLITHGAVVANLTATSGTIFAIGSLMSLFLAKMYHNRISKHALNALHGSAHWATKEEIIETGLLNRRGLPNSEGVVVGGYLKEPSWFSWLFSMFSPKDKSIKILRHNGKEHIMVYAPTRSGKGVSLVFPTLLDGWNESAFVFDIKGENFAGSAGYRKSSLNHKILKLDFTDPFSIEKNTSATFNPLEESTLDSKLPDDYRKYDNSGNEIAFDLVETGTYSETAAIQQIVAIIVDPQGKGLEDHWSKTASSLMLGCITHLLYKALIEHKPCPGISDVLSELTQSGKTSEAIIKSWQSYPHIGGSWVPTDKPGVNKFIPKCHRIVSEEAQSLLNKPDKERGSVISTAVSNLALFRDPIVTRNTSRSSFKIRDLMYHDNPVDLYLTVSPNDQLRLLPLTRLFTTQLVFTLVEKMEFKDGRTLESYKHRLLLLLDEFPSLGRMELFEKALGFIGGYGLKAFIVCQGLAQLYKAYGKEEALRVACHIQIAFAPNEQETCEYLSRLTGSSTTIKENVSETRQQGRLMGGVTKQISLQEVQRNLLTPDECRRLPGLKKDQSGNVTEAGDMLIFPAGYSAIYGRQTLYFMNSAMSERAKMPPPTKSDYLIPETHIRTLQFNKILSAFEELEDIYYLNEKTKKKLGSAGVPEEVLAGNSIKAKSGGSSGTQQIRLLPKETIEKIFTEIARLKGELESFDKDSAGLFPSKDIKALDDTMAEFLARQNNVVAET
jgi:type IV secretion system protein VirD4